MVDLRQLRWLWRRFTYRLYLHTPHWKSIRDYALRTAGYRCDKCGERAHLEVHHLFYVVGGKSVLWHEGLDCLQVLCHHCHSVTHGVQW